MTTLASRPTTPQGSAVHLPYTTKSIITTMSTASDLEFEQYTEASPVPFSWPLYKQWVVTETISWFMMVWNAYLLVSIVVFLTVSQLEMKTGKGKQKKCIIKKLDIILLINMNATFFRLLFNLDCIWGRGNEFSCSVLKILRTILSIVCYCSTFVFLWHRQRVLYSQPLLENLSNKFTRFLSITSVILILVTTGLVAFTFLTTASYKWSVNGCLFEDMDDISPYKWYIVLGCSTIYIFLLLALYLIPLVNHKKCIASSNISAARTNKVIRHAVCLALLAIVSNCATNFAVTFFRDGVDELCNFLYDVNSTICVIACLMCLSDWRERMFPFRRMRCACYNIGRSKSAIPASNVV